MINNLNKKISLGIVFVIIFLLIPSISAHPPTKLNITYDKNNNELIVNITHSVTNINNHYIESVNININGITIYNYNYTSQPDKTFISYRYTISADLGDIIEVKATCSEFGSITKELTVEKNISTSTPEFTLISLIICFISIFLIKYKRK